MASYGTVLDEDFKKLKSFFVDPKMERPRTQLPAYTLFSNLKCNDEENQLELVAKTDIPADIRDKLNDTQLDALVQALGHKASVCQVSHHNVLSYLFK